MDNELIEKAEQIKQKSDELTEKNSERLSELKAGTEELLAQAGKSLEQTSRQLSRELEQLQESVKNYSDDPNVSADGIELRLDGLANMDDTRRDFEKKYGYSSASKTSGGIELTLENETKIDDANNAFEKKYGYKAAKDRLDDIELTLDSNAQFTKVKEEMAKDMEKLDSGIKMGIDADLRLKAAEIAEEMKQKANETTVTVSESGLGKTILGEDGRFDGEDVKRIASEVGKAGSKAVDRLKSLIKK